MPLDYKLTLGYRYEFRNGALVKVDQQGNLLSWGPIDPEAFVRPESNKQEVFDRADKSTIQTTVQEDTSIEMDYDGVPSSPVTEPIMDQAPKWSNDDLAKRDMGAIEYSNSLLTSGDTLVYVNYPEMGTLFSSNDLEVLNQPHRVHSGRLLATGSEKLKKLFEPTYQFRILRRLKLVKRLPEGIKYVLDLTPPEEGDEAVELTANLSCSYGVRMWYTASTRIGVADNLVAGEDDIALAHNISQYGVPSPTLLKETDFDPLTREQDLPGYTSPDIASKVDSDGSPRSPADRQLDEAIALSVREANLKDGRSSRPVRPEVPEYCPIRHRAAIIRLLKVIEGKDPRLDFAPKVWSLFAIAHYLECTPVIVDWVIQWTLADPNSQIVEILPEACLKMAFGMKNQLLCRASFAILVSEEALSLTSRALDKHKADLENTNQFGRFREEVDEDLKTRIEYASKAFNDRVQARFDDLVATNWFADLPEYKKLQQFLDAIAAYDPSRAVPQLFEKTDRWLSTINDLLIALRHYVRGRIVWASQANIPNETIGYDEQQTLDRHRCAEQYKPNHGVGPFKHTYSKLDHKERLMTPFFWRTLRGLDFASNHRKSATNLLLDRPASPLAAIYGIEAVSTAKLEIYSSMVAEYMNEAARLGVFNAEQISNNTLNMVLDEASENDDLKTQLAMDVHSGSLTRELRKISGSSTTEEKPTNITSSNGPDRWHGLSYSAYRFLNVPSSNPVFETSQRIGSLSKPTVSRTALPTAQQINDPWIDDPWSDGWMSGPFQTKPAAAAGNTDASNIEKADPTNIPQPQHYQQGITTELPLRTKESVSSQNFGQQSLPKGRDFSSHSFATSSPVNSAESNIPSQDFQTFLNFDVDRFLWNVRTHVGAVCNEMLSTANVSIDVAVTDTLLCLSDEEFKYLPLWAGGDDDDSGGVFDPAIPVAIAGPNGPGPSFHTGFSNASAPSSEYGGFDSRSVMTSVNTSVGVEDGFSDHLDRRRIFAEDDIHSETFSEDSETYAKSNTSDYLDHRGKGKAIANPFTDNYAASTSSSGSMDDFAMSDDGISDAGTEIGFLTDSDSVDLEAHNNSGVNTTAEGTNDEDNDMWDDGDAEEAFDFGDSDEEMATP